MSNNCGCDDNEVNVSNYNNINNNGNDDDKIINTNLKSYTPVSLNYKNIKNYNFRRFTPNYFRYYDIYYPNYDFIDNNLIGKETGWKSYEEEIKYFGNDNIKLKLSELLRKQLKSGEIILFNLKTILFLILPKKDDTIELKKYKNTIRDELILFSLYSRDIYEKDNLNLKTINFKLKWVAYYDYILNPFENKIKEKYIFEDISNLYLNQYKISALYKISINYRYEINSQRIFRLLGDSVKLNKGDINLSLNNLIVFGNILLNELYNFSKSILDGKDVSIPLFFKNDYFSLEQCKFYIYTYTSLICTKNLSKNLF